METLLCGVEWSGRCCRYPPYAGLCLWTAAAKQFSVKQGQRLTKRTTCEDLCAPVIKISTGFNSDPDPAVYLNTDTDPDPDPRQTLL